MTDNPYVRQTVELKINPVACVLRAFIYKDE